jgi:hypothetical protein
MGDFLHHTNRKDDEKANFNDFGIGGHIVILFQL